MPSGNAGRRYAQAIFDLARSENKLDKWSQDLVDVAQTFDDPKVAIYLDNPKISREKKLQFVRGVIKGEVSEAAQRLAVILVSRHRQTDIDVIIREYTKLVNKERGIEVATVTTAVPVDDTEREYIRAKLSQMIGKQVQVEMKVDPTIIGGIVARVGDTLIDGSVTSRLSLLRKTLA